MLKRGKTMQDELDVVYDGLLVRRVIDIIKILMNETDEMTTISQQKLLELMDYTCCEKTLGNTLEQLLATVNPEEYEDGTIPEEYTLDDYKIQVNGLKEKLLAQKGSQEAKKKLQMRGLRWNHIFSFDEINQLIEGILFLRTMDEKNKEKLVQKLLTITSKNFPKHSPYINNLTKELKKSINGVYENSRIDDKAVKENLKIITNAIGKENVTGKKITFNFCTYNRNHEVEYLLNDEGNPKEYIVSPYYVILYNGKYYLICSAFDYTNVSIYRIDLMKNIQIAKTILSDGKTKSEFIRPKKDVFGMPMVWDSNSASEFLSEHLFMFYGIPRDILIKIDRENYTLLHDWFGDHYTYIKASDTVGWDVVRIKCIPEAVMRWALMNYDCVEILDEELREKMREICQKLTERYEG